MWITAVTLDGVALDLNVSVLSDVTIRHGRNDVYEAGTPSTCQLTVLKVARAFTRAFQTGATLVVTAGDGVGAAAPRFTGKVTDGAVDEDNRLTMIAVGRLSTFQQYDVGAGDWPAEKWSARVTRLFTEAGLAAILELVSNPAADPMLAARVSADDGGAKQLDQALDELAGMVGAAIADRPNGNVLVQAVNARTLDALVVVDPYDVEYAPTWVQQLPIANVVTVEYVGGSVTVQDAPSVARHGPRPLTIKTTFTSAIDAQARANARLSRSANPHWNIPTAPIVRPLTIPVGTPVLVDKLPGSAPFSPWTPIVEGWLDSIVGDEWTMELALSDPLASGLTLPWRAVPAAETWQTINQTVKWKDALTLSDIAA